MHRRALLHHQQQVLAAVDLGMVFGRLWHAPQAVDFGQQTLQRTALAQDVVPGIATLSDLDPACAGLPVSRVARAPRSKVALVLCRGFAGTNAALLVSGR